MTNRILLYWLPLLVWICGIFFISSLPTKYFPAESESNIPTEYLLHITAFFVLFLLFYRLFSSNRKRTFPCGILLLSFIVTMIVSISKECWQLLMPTRSFSLKDILVDGGATTLAVLLVYIRGRGLFSHNVELEK